MEEIRDNFGDELSKLIRKNRKRSDYMKYTGITAFVAGLALTILSVSSLTDKQTRYEAELEANRVKIGKLQIANQQY
ncbi:MAG: hypothetical protein Q8867_04950, partial [Bacteroidota bacterium]|nr:hypothetical protein [Bacteroidota bacterium]